MSKEDIKQKIHRLIDEIDDEEILNVLHEDAVEYKNTAAPVDDELSEEQWASVMEGLTQAETGETYSKKQVMEKIKEWRDTK